MACEGCLKETSNLSKCTGCKHVSYCSKECQKEAWKEGQHKQECHRIKFFTSGPVEMEMPRLMAKIIIKLRQGNKVLLNAYRQRHLAMCNLLFSYSLDKVVTILPDKTQRSFEDLMSHVEEIKKSDKHMKAFNLYYALLTEFFKEDGGVPPKDEVLEIYGKIKINSFSIEGSSGRNAVGTGLYLESSVFDHSCRPNAEGSYIGKKMYVKCTNKDGIEDFSKVRVGYCKLLPLRKERREDLRERYYFDCQCEHCSDEDNVRDAYAVACVKCPGCKKGVPVREESKGDQVVCGHCKKVVNKRHMAKYWELRDEVQKNLSKYGGAIPELIAHSMVRRMKSVFFPTERNYLTMLEDCLRDSTEQVCC